MTLNKIHTDDAIAICGPGPIRSENLLKQLVVMFFVVKVQLRMLWVCVWAIVNAVYETKEQGYEREYRPKH